MYLTDLIVYLKTDFEYQLVTEQQGIMGIIENNTAIFAGLWYRVESVCQLSPQVLWSSNLLLLPQVNGPLSSAGSHLCLTAKDFLTP